MSNYGIRYLVIALGDPNDKATDEDVAAIKAALQAGLGPLLKIVDLSDRVSDQLTVAILREKGVL